MTNKTEVLEKTIKKKIELDLAITSSIISKVCQYLGLSKEELLGEIEFSDFEVEKILDKEAIL